MDNSIYKKCTECGQTKHISEFSKSYPNRCKTCVAEHTRQMRAAEKLKAKVKATGEVIDVEPSGTMQVLCGSFITKDGRRMPGTALEFEKAIDWEQRRYEIAKEIMKGFSANSHNQCVDASSETLAQWSISGANPLYRMGYKRVGCFPCVMASQQDIYNISVQEPERISYIAGLEQQFNSSFFGPDKISSKYYKGEYPLISDVVRYVQSKRAGGSLFDDDVATSCMSYYGLCE